MSFSIINTRRKNAEGVVRKHIYRISMREDDSERGRELEFSFENHDDMFDIIDRISGKDGFSAENAVMFGLGLKLFADVVRKNHETMPFSEIMPLLAGIMKIVKGSK